jgi:hypothetical protein
VNVDRPRLRKRFHAVETVVREKDSASLTWLNQAQAVPARSGILSDFLVRRETITWRLHGRTNGVRDFCWYGHDPNGLHDVCLHVFFLGVSGAPPLSRTTFWSKRGPAFYPDWSFELRKK